MSYGFIFFHFSYSERVRRIVQISKMVKDYQSTMCWGPRRCFELWQSESLTGPWQRRGNLQRDRVRRIGKHWVFREWPKNNLDRQGHIQRPAGLAMVPSLIGLCISGREARWCWIIFFGQGLNIEIQRKVAWRKLKIFTDYRFCYEHSNYDIWQMSQLEPQLKPNSRYFGHMNSSFDELTHLLQLSGMYAF